jgi:hypothetical protein
VPKFRPDLSPGVLVRTTLAIPCFNPYVHPSHLAEIQHGDLWFVKPRYYILGRQWAPHLEALPLTSFSKRGLFALPPEEWREYVGLNTPWMRRG